MAATTVVPGTRADRTGEAGLPGPGSTRSCSGEIGQRRVGTHGGHRAVIPDPSGPERHSGAVHAAVAFVAAQTGGPARLLARHHRRPDGYCAGCTASVTRWPCTAAAIATVAITTVGLSRTHH